MGYLRTEDGTADKNALERRKMRWVRLRKNSESGGTTTQNKNYLISIFES